ncbi:acyltransferase [Chryseobacterium sp. POL2]|uniref:acyltransferase family protein n=1 Tax=Chryseobacterium sp. POL2 TaxID=2713414 RepID=UPI0013E1E0EF|nr:acyltransferase [Chryseobacterium sp. POL2]QIG88338.1 acyltransferase [Chryseobacterium sp. POL2]
MKYNLPNITSARFFLALLVVLFHVMQFAEKRGFPSNTDWAILNKGTEAVFAFFSLSGFLIIRNLYLEKLNTGSVSIKDFYKRRIFRIFPLYYAVLIFGLLYYNVILPYFGFEIERLYSYTEAILLGGTFFSNILKTYQPGGIIEVLWSIGIEEQFYILIAPCFLIFSKKNIVWLLAVFSIVYFILYNFDVIEFLKKYVMYFYFFSVSGLFAIFTIQYPNYKIPNWIKISIYAFVLFYFFSDWILENTAEWMYQLISTLFFPLMIISLISQPISFLENKTLKYFGKISYGIYMLHAIVMQIVGFMVLKFIPFETINPNLFIISFTFANIILTLIFAHISYQYFEKFFLKLGHKKED